MRSEFSKPRLVLDSKPLVKLFAKEDGWEAVQRILFFAEDGRIEVAISVVTLTEIFIKYFREKGFEWAMKRVEELRYAFNVKKLDITVDIAVKAGEFKGKYGIPVADAFIAASAYFDNFVVISDDSDFRKVGEIKTMTEKEFLCSFE